MTIEVPCPQCGKQSSKTLAELQMDEYFQCPACHMEFRPSDVKSVVEFVEKDIEEVRRNLGDIFGQE